jgi:hypothetical protein
VGTGAFSLGVKRLGREADHSPPFSAEVKNACSCTSTPQYALMAWCLVKAQGQLYLLPLSFSKAVKETKQWGFSNKNYTLSWK